MKKIFLKLPLYVFWAMDSTYPMAQFRTGESKIQASSLGKHKAELMALGP